MTLRSLHPARPPDPAAVRRRNPAAGLPRFAMMESKGPAMVIDGHAHSAGEFYDVEGALRTLDALAVDKVVLAPGPVNEPIAWRVPDITRFLENRRMNFVGNRLLRVLLRGLPERYGLRRGNAHVAAMSAARPGRILQAYWVDPEDEAMLEGLEDDHARYQFRVLKVHQALRAVPTDAPVMRGLATFAGDRGLPFFIHIYGELDVEGFVRLARACPATNFILGHLLGLAPLVRMDGMALPNVFLDISPPNMVPLSRLRMALRRFGPARLVMGSDAPFGKENTRAAIARVKRLRIPEESKRLILGGTMARLLSLPEAGEGEPARLGRMAAGR